MSSEINTSEIPAYEQGSSFDPINPVACNQMMENSLVGYLMHRDVVLKKMQHAKRATYRSLHEADASREMDDATDKDEEDYAEQRTMLKTYSHLWKTIIDGFKGGFIAEADLKKIEGILLSLPSVIMKHYKTLVEQDVVLQKLLKELKSETYVKIDKLINSIQRKPCLMAGIQIGTFDIEDDFIGTQTDESAGGRGYKIETPQKKELTLKRKIKKKN